MISLKPQQIQTIRSFFLDEFLFDILQEAQAAFRWEHCTKNEVFH